MTKEATEGNKKRSISRAELRQASNIFRFVGPYRFQFIIGLMFLVIGSFVFMALPWVCGELVNIASGNSSTLPGGLNISLRGMGLVLFGLILSQALLSFLRVYLFAYVSENGMADLRRNLYNKLISLPIFFFEENRVGELTSRTTADVEQLHTAFSITLAEFIRQILTLVIGISVLAYIAPQLSLIMLMTLPVVIIVAMYFGKFIRKLSKNRQAALADTNTIVEETLHNFRTVKAFGNEQYELNRYSGSLQNIVGISLNFAKYRGVLWVFIILVIFGSLMFVMYQGAVLVQQGEMQSGTLLSFVVYTVTIGGSIAGLGNLYTSLIAAVGATDRIEGILKSESEVQIGPHSDYRRYNGSIKFSNLDFSYPGRPNVQVLTDVNIEIKPGEKIALVGTSGGGKSTIAQLLMGFYDVADNSIFVDKTDINTLNKTELRSNMAIVPQEVLLFGGSIKENIKYGNIQATDEEVESAAKQANCHDFIASFPEGYDTVVGDRGVKLSGGQRQRIAIARAILRDPAILILDEATSALDSESEHVVQEALTRLMRDRTSIIIAHRLATIKNVDRIYVIDNGRIVESGSHEELTSEDSGVYNQMVKMQFEM